ncbi:hypothetical protein VST7929_02841 [Vibrio stylophorae]|uniref:Uncharacterized protein n=1 Tax=Vibrio stylophorae TaxID=659351 RepID=A0ABM8ZX16_9VIBR|nr:hypothetical protein [Vibrio stylophorae]CAH0535180.1 hypothetical protein VST7929_02841 [Vibrio stylophorae]
MRKLMILFSFFFFFSWCHAQQFELGAMTQASLLLSQGDYQQSARLFNQSSAVILASDAEETERWQMAGLALVLASAAEEKNGNAKAYQYWARATEYLLFGDRTWPQLQQALYLYLEQQLQLLKTQSAQFGNYPAELQQQLMLIQLWQQELAIFQYQGPRTGLRQTSIVAEESSRDTSNGQSGDFIPQVNTLATQPKSATIPKSVVPQQQDKHNEVQSVDYIARPHFAPVTTIEGQDNVSAQARDAKMIIEESKSNPMARGQFIPIETPPIESQQSRQSYQSEETVK